MELSTGDRARRAEELCAAGFWPELLAFAQKWQDETPRDHRAWYYIGLGLGGMGQPHQAEKAYRRALTLDPTDFEIWNRLSELLYRDVRRPTDGVRCLKQALRIHPDNTTGWLRLANFAGDMGSYNQVLEYADQAIALNPGLIEAYLQKAQAAKALGRLDLLTEACRQLSAFGPENSQPPP